MGRPGLVLLFAAAGIGVAWLLVERSGRTSFKPMTSAVDAAHDGEPTDPTTLRTPEALTTASSLEGLESSDEFDLRPTPADRSEGTKAKDPAVAVIELTVVAAESGAPLDDIQVRSELGGGSSTDSDGRCDWKAPPGNHVLRVGGGWRSSFGDPIDTEVQLLPVDGLRQGEHRAVTVALRTVADRFHHVQIVDSVTKQPVPGALVDLFDPQLFDIEDVDAQCTRVVADSDGRLECWIPSWRVVPVRSGSADHAERFTFLSPSPTSRDSPEVLALDPWPTLEVVLLNERARPTAGIGVKGVQEETSFDPDDDDWEIRLPGSTVVTETDRDGVARFERLVPGMPVHIYICRDVAFDRIIATPVTLAPGETRRVSYSLFETSLRGVVEDTKGGPIAEIPVWLLPCAVTPTPGATRVLVDDESTAARRTTTDRKGRFAFADVTPGWWWVGPAPTGDPPQHGYATLASAVEVRADVATTEVLLTPAGER